MHSAIDLSKERLRLPAAANVLAWAFGVLGLLGLAASFWLGYRSPEGPSHVLHSYLVSLAFFLSIALGALFFVILQHATRAGWSVVLRRIAEIVAANIPILALLAIPVAIGIHHLYHWADPAAVAGDQLLREKSPYLNPSFFVLRLLAYFALWSALSTYYLRASLKQDQSGDATLTLRMQRLGAPALLLYGITVTFASFDLLMSLDPHWFSTIYGVYFFAGGVVGFFALLPLVIYVLQRSGYAAHAITIEHYHDMGKLLFAFVVFWAYIAFSQYMLIWYGNMPEETDWYFDRQAGGWAWVSLALLFGHFIVPFLAVLSRVPKRSKALLAGVALWVLAMHWIDLYWLVMPGAEGHPVLPGLADLACTVGIGGLLVAATVLRMRRHALIPVGDPRLDESRRFENA
ncbi:MAG: quinol:cytochrome C oxidoreductase [Acidobacteriota bacterium]